MKLLPLLPYLFDGTVSKIYDENSTIVVVESPGGMSHIEFRYPDGEKQETELQELTEDDLTDEDWRIKSDLPNVHIDLEYYKTFPFLVGIEDLLHRRKDVHVYTTLLGFHNLSFKRIDGTRVLCLEYGDGDIIRFTLDRETIGAGLFD